MKIFDKKFLSPVFSLFAFFSIFVVFSCKQQEIHYEDEVVYLDGTKPVTDDEKPILKKEYPVKVTDIRENNLCLDDLAPLPTYHFKDRPEGAGFIDVKDVFTRMCVHEFFFDFKMVLDPSKNTLTVFYIDLQGTPQKAVINWEKNTITLSAPATYAFMTDDKRDEVQRWPSYYAGGKETVFDLGKYGFDILYLSKEEACLIPFSIAQTLFFSDTQVYFYFIDGRFVYDLMNVMADAYSSDFFETIAEKTLPRYVKEESWNTLMFEMDYFCGRKEIMLGSRNSSFLNENLATYKEKYLSDDKVENAKALFSFVYGYLDEGHSSIIHSSPYLPLSDYNDKIFTNKADFNGNRMKTLLETREKFVKKKKGKYDFGEEGSTAPAVYYSTSEKTAFINFNDFQNPGVKGEDIQGTIEFYRDCMEKIEEKGTVKNIVLDLTTNGGGSVSNMQYLVGMMTGGKSSFTFKNTQDNTEVTYEWKSDTNGDGVFDENDGYFDGEGNPKYKWHILTSGFSFSCGNFLPTIAKHTGIATVIGQRTGGGICSIRQTVLPDGTKLGLSSPWIMQASRVNEKGEREYFYSDSGVEPDIELTDEEFYCDSWTDFLESVISTGA